MEPSGPEKWMPQVRVRPLDADLGTKTDHQLLTTNHCFSAFPVPRLWKFHHPPPSSPGLGLPPSRKPSNHATSREHLIVSVTLFLPSKFLAARTSLHQQCGIDPHPASE